MKRILLLFLIFTFTTLTANAQTLKAKAIDEISTAYPKDVVRVEVTKNVILSGMELKKGYIVYGTLTDVKSPNKGEKEASFVFSITKYKDLNNVEYEVTKELKTIYKRKHIKALENFLNDTDFAFSPMSNVNMYSNDTDITGKSQNTNSITIKPISVAESLLPKDIRDEIHDDTDYKTGLSSNGEDILILTGDKIKFNFTD